MFAYSHSLWSDPQPIASAERALHSSGRFTALSAGIILGGTFAVLGIVGGGGSNGGQLRAIGFGLAIRILMDTFLVRTLLVPSTVMLLGRWNWWPAAMGRAPERASPEAHAPAAGAPEAS